MRRSTVREVHNSEATGDPRPPRWSSARFGRSLLLFPATVALLWALVIAVFASIGRLWGPEGEQGTWGEVAGAVVGNFVFVFVAVFAVSVIVRVVQRRSR